MGGSYIQSERGAQKEKVVVAQEQKKAPLTLRTSEKRSQSELEEEREILQRHKPEWE